MQRSVSNHYSNTHLDYILENITACRTLQVVISAQQANPEIHMHWKLKEGTEPTITQIAADAGMPVSRVYASLKEMDEKGIISFSRGHYDTSRTEMISDEITRLSSIRSPSLGKTLFERPFVYLLVEKRIRLFHKFFI